MACAIFLFLGGMVGMMWTGGQDVIAGRMSGGDLGAFVFYAVMLGTAFATLSEVWGDLQRAAGAAERLVELLHQESDIPDHGSSPIRTVKPWLPKASALPIPHDQKILHSQTSI